MIILATSCTQYAQKNTNHARHFPAKYASICSSVTSAISLPASRAFSHSTVFCTATEREQRGKIGKELIQLF